mmetsp:Transcript_26470/g.62189  ORF Transcript_26470/g.62189 Transcript_26470/m.62189 type:complete len:420 (-) Transcript_26470:126-1385(-)
MDSIYKTVIPFLPAVMVLPMWLAIGLRDDLLVSAFRDYYPLSLAMVVGSLIAGSIPLGGGVVAFPISVLVIGFGPSQGRDFSLLIQSVGMTAASFLILVTKPDLLDRHGVLLANALVASFAGLLLGNFVVISPFAAMCTYATIIVAFAILLVYVETFLQSEKATQVSKGNTATTMIWDSSHRDIEAKIPSNHSEEEKENAAIDERSEGDPGIKNSKISLLNNIVFITFCLFGGFVSAQIGSGADIACYAYCALVHNSRSGVRKISGNDLTAISVIVMATVSVLGSLLRVTAPGADAVTQEVYQALVACACIVVFGAPLGSLVLTKDHQRLLKIAFYVLAVVQLATFGILKIRTNLVAWCLVVGVPVAVCLAILLADVFVFRTKLTAIMSDGLATLKGTSLKKREMNGNDKRVIGMVASL